MRYITKILIVTVCLIALSGIASACDEIYTNKECKSPGYWKNHPEAWPVSKFTCGKLYIGSESYNVTQAVEIMQQPVKGDKTYTMFDALVAAKLNVKSGCRAPCEINNIITGADRWMKAYELGEDIKASSDAWQKEFKYCGCKYPSGEEMYKKLDAFNNGYYC